MLPSIVAVAAVVLTSPGQATEPSGPPPTPPAASDPAPSTPPSPAPAPPAQPAASESAPTTPPAAAPEAPPSPELAAKIAELEAQYRPRLARTWLRESSMILGATGIAPDSFRIALDLTRRSVEWLPDDELAWRVALEIGRACEELPGGVELRQRAIARLHKLDPADEVIQLLRLSDAVDARETAEERLAAYRKLLSPETRAKLGPRIASRLMFDQALLQNRMGDLDGFATSLAEAISIDPAFPAATQLAAGFFAARAGEPAAAAELMVAAIVANPTRLDTYLDLAAILMAEGAYRSAERIYGLTAAMAQSKGLEVQCDVTADLAIAQWGAGDPGAALGTIRRRLQSLDADYLRYRRKEDSNWVPKDDEIVESPLPPMMVLLNAVLSRAVGDARADQAVARLDRATADGLRQLASATPEAQKEVTDVLVSGIWATLLLGGDLEKARDTMDRLEKKWPLLPEAKQRYDGWFKFRAGELDAAIELLTPLSEGDSMARLGLGLTLLAKGESKEGARHLHAVALSERGTALGIFAADRLFEVVQARPQPGPNAAALDAAVATLPPGFDRLIRDASSALAVSLTPEKRRFAAFEPIRLRLTVQNRTSLTLAIEPGGPIDPRAAISMSIASIGEGGTELPSAILGLDRRIELAPGETLALPIDLSYMNFGAILGYNALKGATIDFRVVVNFVANLPRVGVGFMGASVTTGEIRVDGARVDDAWRARVRTEIEAPDSLLDPVDFVFAGLSLASREVSTDRTLVRQLAEEWGRLAPMWRRYPPVVQAWILMVMPNTMLADAPLLDVMRGTTDPIVLEAFMLRRVRDPEDPVFDVARRTAQPHLVFIADSVQGALRHRVAEMQKEFGLGGDR